MDYRPWTNWGLSRPKAKAGNLEIEAEVFSNVALPGKQLGKLAEATLALAELLEAVQPGILEQHGEQADAIQNLKELNDEINLVKEEHAGAAEEQAEKALERLKEVDADKYRALVDRLQDSKDK